MTAYNNVCIFFVYQRENNILNTTTNTIIIINFLDFDGKPSSKEPAWYQNWIDHDNDIITVFIQN